MYIERRKYSILRGKSVVACLACSRHSDKGSGPGIVPAVKGVADMKSDMLYLIQTTFHVKVVCEDEHF